MTDGYIKIKPVCFRAECLNNKVFLMKKNANLVTGCVLLGGR